MARQIKSFDQLLALTKRMVISGKRAQAAVIGADEASYLKMIVRASEEGLIDPVLIGPRKQVDEIARLNHLNIGRIPVVDLESRTDMISEAIKMVADGSIDFLVRGNMTTGLMLARMFERPNGLRQERNIVSHVAVFEHELYPRLLLMSDGGVTVTPNIDQKLAIIQNAVGISGALGAKMPRVAMLAAVEVIYTSMPVTMEAAIISKMVEKGQIKNCRIDGPLSMDVAVVPEAAEQKGVKSDVAGRADILIAPNIETGNGIYKAMSMFAKARTAGVIVGGKVPIAISSRCDTAESIFHSLVLASFIALSNKA